MSLKSFGLPPFPLDSDEALWYWRVLTDELLLSSGALRVLNLKDNDNVCSMSAFLTHVPPSWIPALSEMRETALSGKRGSSASSAYVFQDFLVHENMLVLRRNATGRCIEAMGHLQLQDDAGSCLPEDAAETFTVGFWLYLRKQRRFWLDRHCVALLQCGEPNGQYAPTTLSYEEFQTYVHPDDATMLQKAYIEMSHNHSLGDLLEHNVRICHAHDKYVLMRLCGSVLERNAAQRITMCGGTLADIPNTTNLQGRYDLAQQDNRRLLYTVNSTGDGLWDWDATTNHVYFSPRYLSMLGYTAEEFPGHLEIWAKRIHPDDHDKIIYPQRAIVESPRFGDTFECTYRLLRKDGSWAWILGRGYVTHRGADGRAIRIVGMHTDITTVQNEREKLEEMVKNDPLTGLRSRAYCNLEMERIEKNHIRPVSLILADINGLKLINDFMGHTVGDKLLSEAAILLREPMRATDCVARTGGDEFVVLLPACDQETCQKLLDRLKACLEKYNADEPKIPVYMALGAATAISDEVPLSVLLRRADVAMMADKRCNRMHTQSLIKGWIQTRTGQFIDVEDERLMG